MARIDAVAVSFFGMSLCKDFNDYYLSIVVPSDLARASLLKNFLLAQNVCFGVRLEGWVAVIPVFFYKNKGLSVQRLVAMCLPPQFLRPRWRRSAIFAKIVLPKKSQFA